MLVCTQKDLVKLPQPELGGVPLWAVSIEIKFLAGKELLEQQLEKVLRVSQRREEH